MTTIKHSIKTIILVLIFASCSNNTPDNISADNYYQLRKQLFKYKGSVDLTAALKFQSDDFLNDGLDNKVSAVTKKTVSYIDSVKFYLMSQFKVDDPNKLTVEEIKSYSFKDSLFSYASLNSIFCGEAGEIPQTKINAFVLRKVIEQHYKEIAALTERKLNSFIFYPNDYRDRDKVIIQWEYQHFFKNNLITTLTTLEKIKQELYLTDLNLKLTTRHDP